MADADIPKALASLIDRDNISEAVVLSTCMRTEVYALVERFHGGVGDVQEFLAETGGIGASAFDESIYCHYEDAAVSHLFEVASGLDSAVLGESEILSQVRRAWEAAMEEKAAGPVLSALFRHAVEVGKRARSETGIARGITSVSQAAVALVERRLDPSAHPRRILVVGAGEMGEGMAAALAGSSWAGEVLVANRTRARAEELAAEVGGRPVEFASLYATLEDVDVVLTSAGSPSVIIEASELEAVLRRRSGRQLLIVDVAVPRNVEHSVASMAGVTLLDLDDIRAFAEAGVAGRRREVERVRQIAADELDRYMGLAVARQAAPLVVALRERAEGVRRREMERFRGRLDALDDDEREVVEALVKGIIGKLLHEPTVRLKEAAGTPRGERLGEALRDLFDL